MAARVRCPLSARKTLRPLGRVELRQRLLGVVALVAGLGLLVDDVVDFGWDRMSR